jgi:hypothetical protein
MLIFNPSDDTVAITVIYILLNYANKILESKNLPLQSSRCDVPEDWVRINMDVILILSICHSHLAIIWIIKVRYCY